MFYGGVTKISKFREITFLKHGRNRLFNNIDFRALTLELSYFNSLQQTILREH